ncbi:MAG: serine/threonine protein kinase [Deltaproteobacteria bacterium]|nr:serine/threonine protein kinase [Deltaproteobacteria bacterium]
MGSDDPTKDEQGRADAGDVPATDELVDQVLDGRYRVLRPLDRGGMGTVFVAQQLNVERLVAIKVMHTDDALDQKMVARFRSEAQIISTLRHPNTLKLFDSGTLPDGRLYLVTELLNGEPLSRVLRRGPLSVARTVEVVREICLSLAEAHSRGVIHRDLKPGNIFLEKVGTQEVVKVLDFGIAKISAAPGRDGHETARGTLMGTPAYLSPEQAYGRPVDSRTDLYSLGVVAYQCLTGKLPFGGEPISQIAAHAEDPPPSFKAIGALQPVPAQVEALVMRLLAKDPKDRPADASALIAELEALQRRSSSPRPSTGWWLAAVLIWMLLGLVIGAWWFRSTANGNVAVVDAGSPDDAGLTAAVSPDAETSADVEAADSEPSSDAEAMDGAELDASVPKVRAFGGWKDPAAALAKVEQLEPLITSCSEEEPLRLTIHFEVEASGTTVTVEPPGPEADRLRSCLILKLPSPLVWPRRSNRPGLVEVDVGD